MDNYVRHLFVMAAEPGPPVVVEEDEMLDFEDIGGIYGLLSEASNNASALQSFLNSRIGEPGIWLQFSGPKSYANKRQPATAYIDLSGGPIVTPVGPAFTFKGLAGAEIVGVNAAVPRTSLFRVERAVGTRVHQRFRDLTIRNEEGSGIELVSNPPGDPAGVGPNALTSIDGCQLLDIGTAVVSPTIDMDGWTDLDSAIFGVFMENADGVFITNTTIWKVAGHGIIAKRWHEGGMSGEVRNCDGSGLKGQEINSTSLSLRSESNKGWGMHVRDCGNPRVDATTSYGSQAATNAWDVWLEGNNYRDTQVAATGSHAFRWRQAKIESSSRITLGSQSGWQYNKIDVSEATRRSIRCVDADWIDPSADGQNAVLEFDLNSQQVQLPTDPGGSNFSTAWSDPSDRPIASINGNYLTGTQTVDLEVQAQSYNAATVDAWWIPYISVINPTAPGTWLWDCEVSVSSGGYNYCLGREVDSDQRQPAFLGSFGFSLPSRGTIPIALWNDAKRKFSGRVHVETSRQMSGIFYVYNSGMEDAVLPLTAEPQSTFTITLHSFRLFWMPGA